MSNSNSPAPRAPIVIDRDAAATAACCPPLPLDELRREMPLLADLVEQSAGYAESPPEMLLPLALGFVNAAAVGRFDVQLPFGARPVVPCGLFILAEAESGSGKSTAAAIMGSGVTHAAALARVEERRAAQNAAEAKEPRPAPGPALLNDSTAEGVLNNLADRWAVGIVNGDAATFTTNWSASAENKRRTCAFYSDAFSGTTVTRDRAKTETRHISRPRLSMLLLSQPGVLSQWALDRHGVESGLSARCLISRLPPAPLRQFSAGPPPPVPPLVKRFRERSHELFQVKLSFDPEGLLEPPVIECGDEAGALLLRRANELRAGGAGDDGLQAARPRAGELLTRLAGALALMDRLLDNPPPDLGQPPVVEECHARAAIALHGWWWESCRRLLDSAGETELHSRLEAVKALLDTYRRKAARGELTERQRQAFRPAADGTPPAVLFSRFRGNFPRAFRGDAEACERIRESLIGDGALVPPTEERPAPAGWLWLGNL